mmetsp:Transcript_18074/g.44983  ORF Transcript_18074/g.44983 Transcript_18074/m.44983 type:complete len:83 (+) Transcript_18074:3007-3255(+)
MTPFAFTTVLSNTDSPDNVAGLLIRMRNRKENCDCQSVCLSVCLQNGRCFLLQDPFPLGSSSAPLMYSCGEMDHRNRKKESV